MLYHQVPLVNKTHHKLSHIKYKKKGNWKRKGPEKDVGFPQWL